MRVEEACENIEADIIYKVFVITGWFKKSGIINIRDQCTPSLHFILRSDFAFVEQVSTLIWNARRNLTRSKYFLDKWELHTASSRAEEAELHHTHARQMALGKLSPGFHSHGTRIWYVLWNVVRRTQVLLQPLHRPHVRLVGWLENWSERKGTDGISGISVWLSFAVWLLASNNGCKIDPLHYYSIIHYLFTAYLGSII